LTGTGTLLSRIRYDWAAIAADPKFRQLNRRKTRFLAGLMLFSIAYYMLLPVGAAWFPELYAQRIFGSVNVGIVFALSEFVVAWVVAILYTRRANADFDCAARDIARDAVARFGGRPQ
jgi:uncharacterized membrane protein (DUF485 family)